MIILELTDEVGNPERIIKEMDGPGEALAKSSYKYKTALNNGYHVLPAIS